MGLPYVPLTFPTITVQTNAKASGVVLSIAEVDRMWEAYKDATVNKGVKPYGDPQGGGNLAILQAVETATDLPRLKVAAWLNALYKAVNEQGWGWLWLDPAGAAKAGSPIINPAGAIKQVATDAGEAIKNFVAPVADPLTNLLKWGAILVVGGAVIYGVYEGHKFFKGRKGRKG